MHSRVKLVAGAAAALALAVTSSMASASSSTVQPINPLAVVSVYGTQASAQVAFPQAAPAAAAARTAVMAQGTAVPVDTGPPGTDYGINWILLGLGAFFFLAGIYTLFDDDDDDGRTLEPISPA